MVLNVLTIIAVYIILAHSLETENNCVRKTSEDCPPWYITKEERCCFENQLPQVIIKYNNTSALKIGYCMTITDSSEVLAQCPYIPTDTTIFHHKYQVLPKQLDQVNSYQCEQFNRKGFLCTECKDGYGLAAYRYYGLMCVECSNSSWKLIGYIILLFIPQTIIFGIFILLNININVHSGNLTGFTYFCHTIINSTFFYPSLIILSRGLLGYWPIQMLLALYGVWNLDFLQFLMPPFCVSTHLTELQLISLGYVSSIYPLILCIITYYLIELHAKGNCIVVKVWRPFHKIFTKFIQPSNIASSVIHTFGTFILLSFGKNLFVSVNLFQGSVLVALDRNTSTLTFSSPRSVDLGAHYFGSTHAPYGALGILGCFLTVILPLVLVLLYPTRLFPKLIQCCGLRRWHAIRTFMEVFVGTYKDGTTGKKKDYRMFAAFNLIARLLRGVTWHANGPQIQLYSWPIAAAFYIVAAVMFAYVKPHKKLHHNTIDVLLLLLIAKICVCLHIILDTTISQQTLQIMIVILVIDVVIPQVVLILCLSYKLALWIHSKDLRRRYIYPCRRYNIMNDDVEDEEILTTENLNREAKAYLINNTL